MGDLTRNFSKSEFACKCGCGTNHYNIKLVYALQELRDLIGKPIIINSAVRCKTHNQNVGGKPNSQHLLGAAADIKIKGMSTLILYGYAIQIERFKQGGIGLYDTFVHVDVRGSVARWNERTK